MVNIWSDKFLAGWTTLGVSSPGKIKPFWRNHFTLPSLLNESWNLDIFQDLGYPFNR